MRKRIKLTEAQQEQIRSMSKDGKRNKEIIEYFKTTYDIALTSSRVYYICYGREGKGVASAEKPRRMAAQRKYSNKKKGAVEEEVKIDDLVKILGQIDSGYKAVLRQIRAELIKSRAQVYEMMKEAGIEIPEDSSAERKE